MYYTVRNLRAQNITCSRGFAVEFPRQISKYENPNAVLILAVVSASYINARGSPTMGIIDRVKEDFYQRICSEVS